MFCGKCGKEIRDSANFCGYCGAPTDNGPGGGRKSRPEPDRQGGRPAPPPGNQRRDDDWDGFDGFDAFDDSMDPRRNPSAGRKKKKKSGGAGKVVAIVLSCVLLLCLVLFLLWFFLLRSGSPKDTVARLEKALNSGNQEALLECYDTDSMDVSSILDYFGLGSSWGAALGLSDMMPKYDLKVASITKTSPTECTVEVYTTVTAGGMADTSTDTLKMVKSGRKWLISLD